MFKSNCVEAQVGSGSSATEARETDPLGEATEVAQPLIFTSLPRADLHQLAKGGQLAVVGRLR